MENGIIHRYDPTPLIEERNEFVREANDILDSIEALAKRGHLSRKSWDELSLHARSGLYGAFERKNLKRTPEGVIDGKLWIEYLKRVDLWDHLPDRYKAQFVDWEHSKHAEAVPFTSENVAQFVKQLQDTRWDWLSERILDAFGYASKRHKSNEAHKIGAKIIVAQDFMRNRDHKLRAIESVVYHVMGDTVPRGDNWDWAKLRAGDTRENKYMRAKVFANENVHITWTEDGKEAVRRMNEVLALGASRKLGR